MLRMHFGTLAIAIAISTGASLSMAEVGKLDVYPQNEQAGASTAGVQATVQTQPGVQVQGDVAVGAPATQPAPNTFQPTPPRPQPTLDSAQPNRTITTQGERYEARKASTETQSYQQDGVALHQALVQKLIKANKAEIELAKMARDRANHDQVRQLTETLIKDHQQLNESLKKLANNDSHKSSQDHSDRDYQKASNENRDQSKRSKHNASTVMVPKELCRLSEEACDNALKMTKQMLQEKEGDSFDMAFVGQQCVAHTMMLAELKAIQNDGPQELQEITEEAIEKTEQHLDRLKQLTDKLSDEDDQSNS